MPEEKLKIIQDDPKKHHFNTKDNQRVNIDHKNDDFIYLSLYKWNEETSLQLVLDTVPVYNHTFSENKIEVENPDFLLRVYPIDTRTTGDLYGDTDDVVQCHDGGLRFELVLKKKRPAAGNSFSFPLVAKNLRCAYQSFLTEQQIIDGDVRRPLNVEGSYAFYHISKKNNKYMTGKAFHLYRPIAEDALGDKVWCTLHINPESTELTVTIPQQFLDEAMYPITIDPDFGYDTTGASASSIAAAYTAKSYRDGSAWPMPAGGGTANWIKAYVGCDDSETVDCKIFINQKDSGGAGKHGQIATKKNLACAAEEHWEEFTLSGEDLAAAVIYILNIIGDNADLTGYNTYYVKFDEDGAVAAASYHKEEDYVAPGNPWVADPWAPTQDYSIFCNYSTEEPPAPAVKPPMGLGLKARPKGGTGRPRPSTGGTSFGG